MILAAPALAFFACTVASVTDGDTLRCADGTRVRLAAVDAPEIGPCRGRRGRVCVPGDGQASRRALEGLVRGQVLRCERVGVSYGRVVAWCRAGTVDLSCAMVRQGAAVYEPGYDRGRRLCR